MEAAEAGAASGDMMGYLECMSTNCVDMLGEEVAVMVPDIAAFASMVSCPGLMGMGITCETAIKDLNVMGQALGPLFPAELQDVPFSSLCVVTCDACPEATPAPTPSGGAPAPAPEADVSGTAEGGALKL